MTFVLILSTGDCNVDTAEQVIYQVNDLVRCRISTTLALWPAEIFSVYTIILVTWLPLTVFRRASCLNLHYPLE